TGTVAQWLALSPHSKKVLGSTPGWGRAFLCGVCMFSLCLCGFPLSAPVSPTIKNMYVRLNSPVSSLHQGTGFRLELGSVQWLPTARQVKSRG
ncbi:hypothetical protein LDENG_00149760, partial [Lucifuga dentata]